MSPNPEDTGRFVIADGAVMSMGNPDCRLSSVPSCPVAP
jgi:hypothetical protein